MGHGSRPVLVRSLQPDPGPAGAWPAVRGPAGPGAAAPTAPHGQQAVAEAASSGSHLGMPIRVPQASLAPQLRAQGGGQGGGSQQAAGGAAPDVDARSPEATRNMMILMQQGWERGRVDDLDDPAGVSDNGTER